MVDEHKHGCLRQFGRHIYEDGKCSYCDEPSPTPPGCYACGETCDFKTMIQVGEGKWWCGCSTAPDCKKCKGVGLLDRALGVRTCPVCHGRGKEDVS